jgi:hypothetical protein
MKIYDIISEKQANEGIRDMAIKTVAKALEPAADKTLKWAASKLGKEAPDAGGSFVQKAKDLYTGTGARSMAPVTGAMRLTGGVITALKYYGLWQITMDYRAAMKRGEAELAAGRWTQDQFDAYHQNQMATMVSQIALSTTFFLALKVTTGWSFMVMALKYSKQPIAKAIGTTLATMAKGTQLALISYLSDKDVRNTIADFAANGIIDNTLGAAGVAASKGFQELIGKAEKKAKGADANNSEPTDTDSTSSTPNAKPNSATGKPATGINVSNDKFKGID